MTLVRIANIVVLLVIAWSVWDRRLTLRSRFDVPTTASLALFGLGAALDSPWVQVSAASYALTGKYYAFMVLGHWCYLAGAAMAIKSVYMRLLPDDAIGPFMRTRIVPLIAVAVVTETISFAMSPTTSTLSADHLYLVKPDGWLTVYWIAHFAAVTALGVILTFGVIRLRQDPRSVMLNLVIASLVVAAISGLVIAYAVIASHSPSFRIAAWLITYAGFAGAAVASAVQWRHRVRSLFTPPES